MEPDTSRHLPLTPQGRFALNYFALFSVFAVVTPYFQKLLYLRGFNEEQIGFITAMLETVGIFAPPLWGWLSDHSRHRRRLLAATILGAAAMFMTFGWVGAFPLAVASAVVFGFFYRPIIPLNDGLFLRYLAEHGGDYGRPRIAGSVAFIIVIFTMEAVGVAGAHGREVILGAMALCAMFHVAAIGALPLTRREIAERAGERRHQRHFDWRLFLSVQFVSFTLVAFLARVGISGYYGFFTLFLQKELGYKTAGYLWILGPVSEIPVIFFSSAIIRRIGVRNMFALGVAGAAVRLTGYAFVPSFWWIVPLQLLHSLTFGAFHTASIHYVHRIAPPDMKQSAVSVFNAVALGVSAIVGNAAGGMLILRQGYRFMYGCYGLVALVALAGLFLFVREPKTPELKEPLTGPGRAE